jgi:hypothetical protein
VTTAIPRCSGKPRLLTEQRHGDLRVDVEESRSGKEHRRELVSMVHSSAQAPPPALLYSALHCTALDRMDPEISIADSHEVRQADQHEDEHHAHEPARDRG